MNKYELVVMVDANLPQEVKEGILKEACDVIAKSEGKVINSQVWIDKHKMPFRIKKSAEATYYLINMEGESAVANKAKQILKLNEKILRFLTIRVS